MCIAAITFNSVRILLINVSDINRSEIIELYTVIRMNYQMCTCVD